MPFFHLDQYRGNDLVGIKGIVLIHPPGLRGRDQAAHCVRVGVNRVVQIRSCLGQLGDDPALHIKEFQLPIFRKAHVAAGYDVSVLDLSVVRLLDPRLDDEVCGRVKTHDLERSRATVSGHGSEKKLGGQLFHPVDRRYLVHDGRVHIKIARRSLKQYRIDIELRAGRGGHHHHIRAKARF